MPIETALTAKFDLSAPILSAPMAGIAGGALAAAVSAAGGLGLIGGGYGDRDWLVRELDIAGNAGIGVGFITWSLDRQPGLLALALERRPRAIFLSFGDLRAHARTVAAAGVPLIAQVQTVRDARIAAAEGASLIVAQGTEAGGHGGQRATMALVPAVVDAAGPVPVVAAGGIADGRGLAAALMLGAAGVLCGTVFYAATEALAHPNVKQAAVAASGDDTVKGRLFDIVRERDWPADWAIRTLRNDFHDRYAGAPTEEIARQRQAYAEAQAAGDVRTAAVIVGEAVDQVRRIAPAGEIVARLVAEAEGRLTSPPPVSPARHR